MRRLFVMQPTQKLEDITSKEYLDQALENAKSWCSNNLPKHFKGFQKGFDYDIFHYVIDNEMIGADMRLDEEQEGLIRVSARKLRWYQEREEYFRRDKLYSKIRKPVEIDPESMFVHEITEFIINKTPKLLSYCFSRTETPHSLAYHIENINRKERGLKEWPLY